MACCVGGVGLEHASRWACVIWNLVVLHVAGIILFSEVATSTVLQ